MFTNERGVTQKWLAQQVGVDSSSLSRAMRGGRNPGAGLVLKIAVALGLSEEEKERLLQSAGYPQLPEDKPPAISTRQERMEQSNLPAQSINSLADDLTAVAGIAASPLTLGEGGGQHQLTPFLKELDEIVAEFRLPYSKRRRAQKLILKVARSICQGIAEEES